MSYVNKVMKVALVGDQPDRPQELTRTLRLLHESDLLGAYWYTFENVAGASTFDFCCALYIDLHHTGQQEGWSFADIVGPKGHCGCLRFRDWLLIPLSKEEATKDGTNAEVWTVAEFEATEQAVVAPGPAPEIVHGVGDDGEPYTGVRFAEEVVL